MGFNTKAIHGGFVDESKNAVNYPVYFSSTFIQPDTEHEGELVCIKKINHPIYGQSLISSSQDKTLKLWI